MSPCSRQRLAGDTLFTRSTTGNGCLKICSALGARVCVKIGLTYFYSSLTACEARIRPPVYTYCRRPSAVGNMDSLLIVPCDDLHISCARMLKTTQHTLSPNCFCLQYPHPTVRHLPPSVRLTFCNHSRITAL